MDVTEQAGVPVPLFIMTSETNDAETRAFLAEKQYFGYPESSVHFFVQEMAPVVDKDGKFCWKRRAELQFPRMETAAGSRLCSMLAC